MLTTRSIGWAAAGGTAADNDADDSTEEVLTEQRKTQPPTGYPRWLTSHTPTVVTGYDIHNKGGVWLCRTGVLGFPDNYPA